MSDLTREVITSDDPEYNRFSAGLRSSFPVYFRERGKRAVYRRGDYVPPLSARELLIAILICCAALVVIAALTGCKRVDEPTFEPEAYVWDSARIPLAVTVEDGLEAIGAVEAIETWNAGRCRLLRYAGIGGSGDIVVRVGDDVSESSAGGWELRTKAGRVTGVVLVRKPGDSRMVWIVTAHELGHVLGLAHDRTQTMSIMHPEAAGSESGYINATHADLGALGRRYCL